MPTIPTPPNPREGTVPAVAVVLSVVAAVCGLAWALLREGGWLWRIIG